MDDNYRSYCWTCESNDWSDPILIGLYPPSENPIQLFPPNKRSNPPDDPKLEPFILRACRFCGSTQIKSAFRDDEWKDKYGGRDHIMEKMAFEELQARLRSLAPPDPEE